MDFAGPRRWKLAVGLAVLVLLYWLALFVATHVPGRLTPHDDPYSVDKFEHLAAFAALAALLSALGSAFGARSWKFSAAIIVLIAVYALLDELSQSLVRRRTPDVLDWLADMSGACLGVALFRTASWLIQRRVVPQVRSGN